MDEKVLAEVQVGETTREIEIQPGETIVDACIREDFDVPYSCRSGACSTCLGIVTAGKVEMDVNEMLSDEEVAQGQTLCCQARPVSTEKIKVRFVEE